MCRDPRRDALMRYRMRWAVLMIRGTWRVGVGRGMDSVDVVWFGARKSHELRRVGSRAYFRRNASGEWRGASGGQCRSYEEYAFATCELACICTMHGCRAGRLVGSGACLSLLCFEAEEVGAKKDQRVGLRSPATTLVLSATDPQIPAETRLRSPWGREIGRNDLRWLQLTIVEL